VALVVVKLGSSIVADARGEVRADVLAPVCDAVAAAHRGGDGVVLVTSGAIARGMALMALVSRPAAMADLQAASAVGQGPLYRVYSELLAERALPSAQVLLTFFDLSARTHYLNARTTLRTLLGWRVVPVINENDTTTTDEISFGDNDFLSAQVAILLGADRLVLLTDTDGLHTADPGRDPSARLVRDVRSFAELDQLEIGFAASPLGSGGMRSKVLAAEMATAAGIPATVARGTDPAAVAAALAGEEAGTRFHPQRGRASSFKLWLRYAKPSHGTLTVDAGAERALRERGTSLLPVGILAVGGEFAAGDAVQVLAAPGGGQGGDGGEARVATEPARPIGKGIVNYSSVELRRIQGMKSEAVRAVLPRAAEEAVHRDYFVLE
jgi:glutamate 5-kinase